MPDVYVEGLIVDEESGEIIEELTHLGPAERIARRHAEYIFARGQEEAWKATRQLYGRAILDDLATLGVKTAQGPYGKATAVPDAILRTAEAATVYELGEERAFGEHDPEDLILYAAKDLDVGRVETWLDNHITDDALRAALKASIIRRTVRSGYARLSPPRLPAPKIRKTAGKGA